MDERIVIVSDTHLGNARHGVQGPEHLRELWQGATQFIINGDVAELHDPLRRAYAARQVMHMQTLCARDGVDLLLISGNHDPMLTDQRLLVLGGGLVVVTHGDVLHPAISPWTAHARELREANARALDRLPEAQRTELAGRLAAVQHASSWRWERRAASPRPRWGKLRRLMSLPATAAKTLYYWQTLYRRGLDFLAQEMPRARFLVFGHYHHRGVWQRGERVVINTGAFTFPARPQAVILSPGSLEVRTISWQGRGFRLARQARRVFTLSAVNDCLPKPTPLPAPTAQSGTLQIGDAA